MAPLSRPAWDRGLAASGPMLSCAEVRRGPAASYVAVGWRTPAYGCRTRTGGSAKVYLDGALVNTVSTYLTASVAPEDLHTCACRMHKDRVHHASPSCNGRQLSRRLGDRETRRALRSGRRRSTSPTSSRRWRTTCGTRGLSRPGRSEVIRRRVGVSDIWAGEARQPSLAPVPEYPEVARGQWWSWRLRGDLRPVTQGMLARARQWQLIKERQCL